MDKEVISSKAVRQVLSDYFAQYKKYPLLTFFALLAPAIGDILVFYAPPLILGRIINTFVELGEITLSPVIPYLIWFGFLWFLGEAAWRIGIYCLIELAGKGINALSRSSFQKLMQRDHEFYSNNFVGSLTKKSLAYARHFEGFTDTLSMSVVTSLIPLIFAIVILWQYYPLIPLVLVVFLSIAVAICIPIIRKRSKLVALRHEASSKSAGRLSDAFTNVLAVKSFAKEKKELQTFGEYVDDLIVKFRRAAHYHNMRIDLVISPLYVLTNIAGLVITIYLAEDIGLSAGNVVVVVSYFMTVTRVFWQINRIYRNIESSIGEAAEFTQLVVSPPAVEDIPKAKNLKLANANIYFDAVSFDYGKSENKTSFLNNFSLDVKAKERVGLIGPSGSGKTTITKLLLRFIDVQSGAIKIDGQDISKVTQESLRKSIAYVPQEPMLFHRTLKENISYGNDKATEAEIIKASKLARAHEFIVTLPHGYNTLVGERGIKLSGGQRQRIAIARAILKQAPILILDEATSSLDSESEKYIQEGLKELMKGKTVIVIAHRLSTIRHLDRIVVLDKGKIVQDGTHDQLIKQKGMYSKLWNHQSGGFIGDDL